MQLTFKDWGSPHGIAGSIKSNDPKKSKQEAERILFYQEELTPQGGRFELFRESQHTDEDVNRAKSWLRHNHDVVGIKVVKALV
jgi:hypothetical protein